MKKFVFAHKFKAIGKMFSVYIIKEQDIDGEQKTTFEKKYDLNFDKDSIIKTQYRAEPQVGGDRFYLVDNKIQCLYFDDEASQESLLNNVNSLNWSYVISVQRQYGGIPTRGFGISDGKVYYLFRNGPGETWGYIQVKMNNSEFGIPNKAVKLQRIIYDDDVGAECFFIDENSTLWYIGNTTTTGETDYCKTDIEFENFLNQNCWWIEGDSAFAISKSGSLYLLDAETNDGTSYIYCEQLQDGTNDKVLNAYILSQDHAVGFGAGENFCCSFGFKESGLYCIEPGGYRWKKIENCPDFITTNFIGSTWLSSTEEDGDEGPIYIPRYESQALFIDKTGKLYKALVNYTKTSYSFNVDENNPFLFEQVGTDSDWNYVPAEIGERGSYLAQKGGKLVKLTVTNYNITYTEHQQPDQGIGKLICENQSMLIFKNGKFEYDITKL